MHRAWLVLALLLAARPAAAAVALPDTGLFVPVAARAARGRTADATPLGRAEDALRVQDFAAVDASLAGADRGDPRVRALRFAALRAHDDGAAIDSLATARLATGDAGNAPEL